MHINTHTKSRQFGCLQFQFNCLYLAMMFPFTFLRLLWHGNRCNWERFVQQKGNQYVINLPYNWNLPTMIFDVVYGWQPDFYSLHKTRTTITNDDDDDDSMHTSNSKCGKHLAHPFHMMRMFFKHFLQFSTRWMLMAWIGLFEPSCLVYFYMLHAPHSLTHALMLVFYWVISGEWNIHSAGLFLFRGRIFSLVVTSAAAHILSEHRNNNKDTIEPKMRATKEKEGEQLQSWLLL